MRARRPWRDRGRGDRDGTSPSPRASIATWIGGGLVGVAIGISIGVLVSSFVGRDGADDGAAPVAGTWVALGDSYSSGTGLGDVELPCNIQPGTHSEVAHRREGRGLDFVHAACHGATIDSLLERQLADVDARTRVATLTIGGNDMGFGSLVRGCIPRCDDPLLEVAAPTGLTWNGLEDALVDAYAAILDRMAPEGSLYTFTYPLPFSLETPADATASACSEGGCSCESISWEEQRAANAFVTRLGDVIVAAAVRTQAARSSIDGSARVAVVEWRTGERVPGGYAAPSGQRFDIIVSPDGLCGRGGRSILWGLRDLTDIGPLPGDNHLNSFHPTSWGYRVAERALVAAVRSD